jgi:hypothetical protein
MKVEFAGILLISALSHYKSLYILRITDSFNVQASQLVSRLFLGDPIDVP